MACNLRFGYKTIASIISVTCESDLTNGVPWHSSLVTTITYALTVAVRLDIDRQPFESTLSRLL